VSRQGQPARSRRLPVIAALFGLAALLASCSVIRSVVGTDDALRNAGFQSSTVDLGVGSSGDYVRVTVSVPAAPTAADADEVASIVWRHVQERFAVLYVTVDGAGSAYRQSYGFDQLQAMFGPRNPSWNRTNISSAVSATGVGVIVGLLALVVAVVVIVLAVGRRRRRRGPPSWVAPGGYGPGGYLGHGAAPAPGGYGPGGGAPSWPPSWPPPADPPYPTAPGPAGPEGHEQAGPEGHEQAGPEGHEQAGPEGHEQAGPEGHEQAGPGAPQPHP
jgi:hypothetical protein